MKIIRVILATSFLALATCATVPVHARFYYGAASLSYGTDTGITADADLAELARGFAK